MQIRMHLNGARFYGVHQTLPVVLLRISLFCCFYAELYLACNLLAY
jgi:hypothetical protein